MLANGLLALLTMFATSTSPATAAPVLSLSPSAQTAGRPQTTPNSKHKKFAVQSKRIEFQECSIHYLLAGPAEGRPVVLLHGGRFTAHTWVETGTIEILAQAGYRVLAVDLPGYGKSTKCPLSREVFLLKLLAKLDLDKPVIVSPSMSGSFSLPLLVEHPDKVSAFVAVAPVGITRYRLKLARITVPTLAIWGEKD